MAKEYHVKKVGGNAANDKGEVAGGRQTIASASGTVTLDLSQYSVFEVTLTGAVTIALSNLPTGTDTQTIYLVITGNFALTLPAYLDERSDSLPYDGTETNHLVIAIVNGNTGNEFGIYYNSYLL